MNVNYSMYRNRQVRIARNDLDLGDCRIPFSDTANFGDLIGPVSARAIVKALETYERLTDDDCYPQLAALVFDASFRLRALDLYFPIVRMLTKSEVASFYQLVQGIARHPNFDLQLIGNSHTDITHKVPASIAHIVAGHIVEVFFYRQDILERLFAAPRHFQLYVTAYAFQQDGGQAGGDYNPERESVQLIVSRLFEGFFGETAGVAPFLHEFGHMLDFFDASTGMIGQGEGLLPGLSPRDGAIYTPRARALFLTGKRLELERYLTQYTGTAKTSDPLPIGHPYVFQNDTEFIAGYFEMFFRNPNYFGAQNSDLYSAFVDLFGYDPCNAWPLDFPFYINENRNFYLLSGQKPWPPHLTIPEV